MIVPECAVAAENVLCLVGKSQCRTAPDLSQVFVQLRFGWKDMLSPTEHLSVLHKPQTEELILYAKSLVHHGPFIL